MRNTPLKAFSQKKKKAMKAIKEVDMTKDIGGSEKEKYLAKLRGDYIDLRGKSKKEQKEMLKKHDITEPEWHKKRSPAKQKKDQQKIVGEQTGLIKTDKKGQKYVLQDYDTYSGMMKGDTIQLSPDAPVVDEYLMGGDYYGKETKESKKRKKGPKTYKVNIEE